MKKPISIVLIEDNRMLREGLANLIREQPDFQVLAASANIIEALQKVREAKPRVVLVDFALQNHDSLRLTAMLHREVPEAKVIVMGLLAQHEDIADFVRAGASGFVMKDAAIEGFFATIRTVASGTDVLPTQLTGSLFKQIVERAVKGGKSPVLEAVRLTQRERQVVELIGEGLSNKFYRSSPYAIPSVDGNRLGGQPPLSAMVQRQVLAKRRVLFTGVSYVVDVRADSCRTVAPCSRTISCGR